MMIDLNDLADSAVLDPGWLFTSARDINDIGQIVELATNSIAGQSHAILLAPHASPAAYGKANGKFKEDASLPMKSNGELPYLLVRIPMVTGPEQQCLSSVAKIYV